MSARDEQREAEMARGREIAARHREQLGPEYDRREREHTIRRLCAANKMWTKRNDHGDVEAYVDDIKVAAERLGPAWPSEVFVANCVLAATAIKGNEGIPEYAPTEDRAQRDARRAHMGQWKAANEGKK